MGAPLEIERKFVIAKMNPDEEPLKSARASHITQTYLRSPEGSEERVRARNRSGVTAYTHTVKRVVGHGVREEHESEVSATEYTALLERADPSRVPVIKVRWELAHQGLTWEIDALSAPRVLWLAEVELPNITELDKPLNPPPGVVVLSDVTGDASYGNAALASPWSAGDALAGNPESDGSRPPVGLP